MKLTDIIIEFLGWCIGLAFAFLRWLDVYWKAICLGVWYGFIAFILVHLVAYFIKQ